MTSVTGTTSTTTSGSSSSAQSLSANYELFLTLLTTQVQNQDPLEPLDSSEYTNQLVQYASVEQSIQTNEYLEALLQSSETDRMAGYMNYLGTEVTAAGGTTALVNSEASWQYDLDEDASGTVEITNSAGDVVYSEEVSLEKGKDTFTWDGKNNNGGTEDDGSYTISFNLKDEDGNAEGVSVEIEGVVDGIDYSSGDIYLKIGDITVPVGAVKSVKSV